MKNIAFDLGASSGKMMLGEFDGNVLKTEIIHRFENHQIDIQGSLYWNIMGIYENLLEGIRKAHIVAKSTITSLGIDTYSNDFAFVGEASDIITQMHCYRDPRTARYSETIYQKILPKELHLMTGNQNALFNTVIQLAAMVEAGESYLFQKGNTLLLLPDLLGYLLTGEKRSEYTISSVTQMFDYKTNDWYVEILDCFGINRHILAPIIPSGSILGKFTKSTAVNLGVENMDVVSVCEHDTASAVVAIPTNMLNVAFISSGTWSLVGVELSEPVINEDTYKYNLAIEGGSEGKYRLLKNVMGLWLIQECRRSYLKVGKEYSYADFGMLALKEKPFYSLIDPDDSIFYMPGEILEKIKIRCTETRQPIPETPGQFIRCIVESLALKYRWTIEKLEHIIGHTLNAVYILGGGGQDNLLNQFTANACAKPVLVGPTEAALTGNLLMQLHAYGEISNIAEGRELIARSNDIKTFLPQDMKLWNEMYNKFITLFQL